MLETLTRDARLAELAYGPDATGWDDDLADRLAEHDFALQDVIDHNGNQVYLAAGRGVLYLAFRGTDPHDLRDWRRDLQVGMVQLERSVRAHGGFVADVADVWDRLNAALDGWLDKPLVIVGHSRGGGDALIAAWRLNRLGANIVRVSTFGAPMVGNRGFRDSLATLYGSRTWRVVRATDLVPRIFSAQVVLSWLCNWERYYHCGRLVWISPGGGINVEPRSSFVGWSIFGAVLRGYLTTRPQGIKDHSIAGYRAALERFV